jgi:hypothetical protein
MSEMISLKQAAEAAIAAWDRSKQWPFPNRPDREFEALRKVLTQTIILSEIKEYKNK